MSRNVHKTLEQFLVSLHGGRYRNEASAKRTLGHLNLSPEEKANGREAIEGFFTIRVNITPSAAELKQLRAHYLKVKGATGISWEALGKELGVSDQTLIRIMNGDNVRPHTMRLLRAGLKTYPLSMPAEVKNPTEKVKRVTMKDVIHNIDRASVLVETPASPNLPSLAELDSREFYLIQRLREHHRAGGAPRGINGVHKLED